MEQDSTYALDFNSLSSNAFSKIQELDNTFIGTPDYMGVAYFWGCHGVKHYLRDATFTERCEVHRKWLEAGLDLIAETDEHYRIITEVMNIK